MEGVQFGEWPYLKGPGKLRGFFGDARLTCAYSPDGKTIAIGFADGVIRTFDTETCTRTHRYQAHADTVTSLMYSPSGDHLLSGGSDCTLQLWDCMTKQPAYTVDNLPGAISTIAFSPCGDQFALACATGRVLLCGIQTGAAIYDWGVPGDKSFCMSYSPDGQHITICDSKGSIWRLDTHSREIKRVVERVIAGLSCMVFSPDGQWVASAVGNQLQLLETATVKRGLSWKTPDDISMIAFSPNGQSIATTCNDNKVRLWSLPTGARLSVFTGHSSFLSGMAFSPTGSQLMSYARDGTVRVWEVPSNGAGFDFRQSSRRATEVAYSLNGQSILSGYWDNKLRLYDAESGESRLVLQEGPHDHGSFTFSPDSLQVVTYDYDRAIRIWDIQTEKCSGCNFSDHPSGDELACVAFSRGGDQIVFGGWEGAIRIMEVDTGECTTLIESDGQTVRQVEFSPKDTHIAISFGNHSLYIWRKQDTTYQHRLVAEESIYRFAYSSCGEWIATAGEKIVQLWRYASNESVGSWTCVASIGDFFEFVFSISWRPGMLEFATACEDGSIRTWRLVEDKSGKVFVRQVWGVGLDTLAITGAIIDNTVGLSAINKKLLMQRGAKDSSTSSEDILSEDEGVDSE
ncbi:MAG: WD40-repeat-containing domain protein [Linnemannia gamsii]|nr:MAG: WD40-repeat-containing domain protein [Linnemannia gamsii]